jgi:hypothetical protein
MPARIRSRLTYANVTATLALVFAMSSGALAAKHYLISSTKQISPKVLKALKGRTGSTGPAGQTGPKGKAGPAGKQGKPGANGAGVTSRAFAGIAGHCTQGGAEFTATNDTTFACNGSEGKEGSPWTAGGTLPSGKTETGTWAFVSNAEGLIRAPLSFSIPTKEPLKRTLGGAPVELLEPGEEDPIDTHPGCPGTVDKPEADPGVICVYAEKLEDPLYGQGPPRTSGVVLIFKSSSSASKTDEGTWAVTAP